MTPRRSQVKPRPEEVGDIVTADDGLPAAVVNEWTEDKHYLLREYLNLQSHARTGWLREGGHGATYADLFCGSGRAKVIDRPGFIEGSAVLAWKNSLAKKTPFSAVYIADANDDLRDACESRLRDLGAPVESIRGTALEAVACVADRLPTYGLHFAFLDPFNLQSLDLEIIRTLAQFKHMDILVHISAMDMRRNAEKYLAGEGNRFDKFAPGWTEVIKPLATREDIYRSITEHWQSQVDGIGMETSTRMHAIRNFQNQVIYWLLLLYRDELADKFWNIVLKHQPNQTRGLFD